MRCTLTAQALHWLSALLILATLPVAWVMMSLPAGREQDSMFVLHRSIGVTIFAIAVARLGWRLSHPCPPRPPAPHRLRSSSVGLPIGCFLRSCF
jgi:cytochrome b561